MRRRRMIKLGLGWLFLGLAVLLLTVRPAPGRAQPQSFNPAGVPVGTLYATSSTWNFDGTVPAGNGPWASVSVTSGGCTQPSMGNMGTGPPLIIFTAPLSLASTAPGSTAWQGSLSVVQGAISAGSATGHVRVVTPATNNPLTQVDVTIWGLSQQAQGGSFWVCLQGASSGPLEQTIAADMQFVQGRTFSVPSSALGSIGFQISDVVSTTGPDNTTFIGMVGFRSPSADGNPMWVFFFNGTTYLGTDTAVPSSNIMQLDSPGPGQINVTYSNYAPNDPLCCPSLPPVTITYTWNGVKVTPSGTPPSNPF